MTGNRSRSPHPLQEIGAREVKKVPTLRGRTVCNLFLEDSTRTRISFDIAAKRLSPGLEGRKAQDNDVKAAVMMIQRALKLLDEKVDVTDAHRRSRMNLRRTGEKRSTRSQL